MKARVSSVVLVVLAASVFLLTEPSRGSGVNVDVSTSSADCGVGNVGVEVTVEVSGLEGDEKWKDLHLYPAHKKTFPPFIGGQPNKKEVHVGPEGAAGQPWTAAKDTSGGLNVYAENPDPEAGPTEGFGNGTYKFTLCFKDPKDLTGMHPVTWKATNDGTKSPSSSDVIDDNEGKPAPNWPQLTLSLANGEHDVDVAIGSSTQLVLETDPVAAGLDYEVHHSLVLDEDLDDVLRIGIEAVDTPVPPAWGLTMSNFAGEVAAGGGAAPQPTLTVPNDPALVGKTFYLVLVLKDEAGSIIAHTHVIALRITA